MRSATNRWKAAVTACLAPVLALMASPAPLTSIAGTWRVRRVLSPDSRTTLIASSVFVNEPN